MTNSSFHASGDSRMHVAGTGIDAPMMSVHGVRKSYRSGAGSLDVLCGVDLRLERGEFIAIKGQSGSGKSTLLHLMGLLDAPDSGEVRLAGERIDTLSSSRRDRLRNTSIGMVFQSYHLLPELSAMENVLAPLLVRYGVLDWIRFRSQARSRAVNCSNDLGSVRECTIRRDSFPVAKCSESPSPGHSLVGPKCSSLMNPQEISIPSAAQVSSTRSAG